MADSLVCYSPHLTLSAQLDYQESQEAEKDDYHVEKGCAEQNNQQSDITEEKL
jgi:hypothetical protein